MKNDLYIEWNQAIIHISRNNRHLRNSFIVAWTVTCFLLPCQIEMGESSAGSAVHAAPDDQTDAHENRLDNRKADCTAKQNMDCKTEAQQEDYMKT